MAIKQLYMCMFVYSSNILGSFRAFLHCLCMCLVTSRSLTRRVRRHLTAKRNRSTVRQTASENTRTQTHPSSMKMGHSSASTEVARRAASVLTRTGRHHRHCRHLYNAWSILPPACLPCLLQRLQPWCRPTMNRCCSSCSFVLSSKNWQTC